MANLDITPQGVSKPHRTRNIVLSGVVALAVVAGVGTVAGCGNSSVKKVATSPSDSAPAYTPPSPVYTAPVFPPAPVVPTPTYTPPAPAYTPPTPTAKTGPEQLSFGDVGVITDGDSSANVTLGAPKFATSSGETYSTGADVEPPKNGLYEVFTVSFVGVTGKFDANEFSFYVRGTDGTHYTGAFVTSFEPQLSASTLTPGEPLKGNIVFDVPAKSGTLVYESGSEALGEWK